MAAIDNKHLLDILAIEHSSGISAKNNKPWEMFRAKCVITGPDNSIGVGQLLLPKTLQDTPPGRYLAEFELAVGFDLQIVPRIIALHPHGAPKPTAKATEPAKASA